MTQQQYTASMVKAASMGLTQSLINRGATPEQAALLANAYADPNTGLLAKRAHNMQRLQNAVGTMVAVMRQA
jgi:hypothetical protein